ncbi:MAG: hypothetical protein V2A78_08130 [bacterium]
MKNRFAGSGSWRKGIALPVAIAIALVIVVLTAALILQAITTGGLTRRIESRGSQKYAGEVVGAAMMEIFGRNGVPDPAKLAAIGLSAPPPAPGGNVVPFKGKAGDVTFSGSFNGGESPWSTYQPVPSTVDPKQDGFFPGNPVPCFDPGNFYVPPQHSLIFVNARTPKEGARRFFYMFSNMSPYGALAPRGNVSLKEATFTADPWNYRKAENLSAQKVFIGAGRNIQVAGALQGVARSARPASEKPINIGDPDSGTAEPDNPMDGFTEEQVMQLLQELETALGELEKSADDIGFMELAMAMAAATALFQGQQMIQLGGFSYDLKDKILTWNNSLYVPRGMIILIPFSIKIEGDLLVEDKAAVVVGGKLKIAGHMFIGKESAVFSTKSLECNDRVEVTYSPKEMLGISAGIGSFKNITLGRGVRHLKFKPGKGNVNFPFSISINPFPEFLKIHGILKNNPLFEAFAKAQKALFAPLMRIAGKMSQFMCGPIAVPAGTEDREEPGLLIAAPEGSVRIIDHDTDAMAAGLIATRDGIVIENSPDGSGIFTGLLVTYNGDIQAFATALRFYPYFTHGLFPVGSGEGRFVQLSQPHLVSSGEYKK